jgi:peptidylprolyl isomerase
MLRLFAVLLFAQAALGLRLPAVLRSRVALRAASSSTPEIAGARLQRRVVSSVKSLGAIAAAVLLARPIPAFAAADETITDQAFFDISIDGAPAGRIVFGLFGKAVPRTAQNFLSIAKGTTTPDGQKLTYANSPFHRIIPGFMCQGGDITRGDGRGGVSIYGGKFGDENFQVSNKELYLSMANAGRDTNGSQFFIITRPTGTPWLDGKHVSFGKVVSGQDVVKKIESYGTESGKPNARIIVSASGQL